MPDFPDVVRSLIAINNNDRLNPSNYTFAHRRKSYLCCHFVEFTIANFGPEREATFDEVDFGRSPSSRVFLPYLILPHHTGVGPMAVEVIVRSEA